MQTVNRNDYLARLVFQPRTNMTHRHVLSLHDLSVDRNFKVRTPGQPAAYQLFEDSDFFCCLGIVHNLPLLISHFSVSFLLTYFFTF